MKRKLIIPGLLAAMILFSAKKCTEDTTEAKVFDQADWIETRDSLSRAFVQDFPDGRTLMAFETQAFRKLEDFIDYLRIASADTLDPGLRALAGSMISSLFLDGNVPNIPVAETAGLVPGSAFMEVPLHRSGLNEYRGEMVFLLQPAFDTGTGSAIPVPERCTIDVFMVRQPVPVGSDTLETWKVFLGSVD